MRFFEDLPDLKLIAEERFYTYHFSQAVDIYANDGASDTPFQGVHDLGIFEADINGTV